MRSVVVVLPASMWAMIPMFRTLDRSVLMSTAMLWPQVSSFDDRVRLTEPWCAAPAATPHRLGLPAVVGERLVGLGHLVGVLTTLYGGAQPVGGVQDLVHQALRHRLLPPLTRVAD